MCYQVELEYLMLDKMFRAPSSAPEVMPKEVLAEIEYEGRIVRNAVLIDRTWHYFDPTLLKLVAFPNQQAVGVLTWKA